MLSMIVPTLVIGFLFHRTITGPMRELVERTNQVGKGDRDALHPLQHHGTSEFALLSQSFLDMARRLNTRSSFISTFATHVSHELKSPLTSIQGAAELLREDVDAPDMDDADRRKFLDNIIADADRLAAIAGRLRDFARAENPIALGAAKLSVAIAGLRRLPRARRPRRRRPRYADAHIRRQRRDHPFQSCRQRHAPWQLHVRPIRGTQGNWLKVIVSDDGEGVSSNNRTQIFDSFFTTRRDSGGTGMGLAIVRAMLDAHGGAIRLIESGPWHQLRADMSSGGCRGRMMPDAPNDHDSRREDRSSSPAPACALSSSPAALACADGLGFGLSAFVVKYGGSMLWGSMVFFLVAMAASLLSRPRIALIARSDRHRRRTVPAGPFPVARRLPADAAGRAAARADVFEVEHGGLWRRDWVGLVCWIVSPCPPAQRACAVEIALGLTPPAETARSGAALPRCGASIPCAGPSSRRADPAPFLHQQFSALAVGLQVECGDDVLADPAPAARNSRTRALPSVHRPRILWP